MGLQLDPEPSRVKVIATDDATVPPRPGMLAVIGLISFFLVVTVGLLPAAEPAESPAATVEGPRSLSGSEVPAPEVQPGAATADHLVALVALPLNQQRVPAAVTVAAAGRLASRTLAADIFGGLGRRPPGMTNRLLWLIDGTLVFMSLDTVTLQDSTFAGDPVVLGSAIYLLQGSEPGHLWAVGSGSHTVRDVDVVNRVSGPSLDMSAVGAPLAAFAGGLVVAPSHPELGRFALWAPGEKVQSMDVPSAASLLGAGGNHVVFSVAGRLVGYDTQTGIATTVPVPALEDPQITAVVSPSGKRIAVIHPATVTELASVEVIDTTTGASLDRVAGVAGWQLHWISDHELVYLEPVAADRYELALHDVETGESTRVLTLRSPAYWFTAAPSP